MSGIDDAIEEMQLGDLEGAPKMSPIDYAKSRGIYPQKVYQAIRNHRLSAERCGCGRKVIDVQEADELFGLGRDNASEEEGIAEDAADEE